MPLDELRLWAAGLLARADCVRRCDAGASPPGSTGICSPLRSAPRGGTIILGAERGAPVSLAGGAALGTLARGEGARGGAALGTLVRGEEARGGAALGALARGEGETQRGLGEEERWPPLLAEADLRDERGPSSECEERRADPSDPFRADPCGVTTPGTPSRDPIPEREGTALCRSGADCAVRLTLRLNGSPTSFPAKLTATV